jgi:protease-4
MKQLITLGFLCGLFAALSVASADDFTGSNISVIPQNLVGSFAPSVAVTDDALSGVINPAGLAIRHGMDLYLLAPYNRHNFTNDVGLYLRLGTLGFATEWVRREQLDYERYMLGNGFRFASGVYFGFNYSWYRGIDRGGSWGLGLTAHPCQYFSLAAVFDNVNEPRLEGIRQKARYTFGVGIRPWSDRVTVSANAGLFSSDSTEYGDVIDWNFRVDAEPVDGILLSANFRPKTDLWDASFGAGLGIALGNGRLGSFVELDNDGEVADGTDFVQFSSGYQRTFLDIRHKYVTMTIKGDYPEEKPGFRLFAPRKLSFAELLGRVRRLENDPRVDGMILTIDDTKMSIAQYQEFRDALESFKEAGKKIVCYMESCGNMEYYLASVADKITVTPAGDVNVIGMMARAMFFKDTLDKLGIKAEVYHIGDYKTASDMLTRDSMSDAQREMLNWLLDDLYNQNVNTIAASRGWSVEKLHDVINNGPYTAHGAYKAGLIDTLIYQDQIKDVVKEVSGGGASIFSGNIYWQRSEYETEWETPLAPKIAIIYATGNIVSGKSGNDFLMGKNMGSETIVEAIRRARGDPRVKAIVFRIDSGGGSGLASDVILREVQRTVTGKDAKPFIVSMGGVAGSGGYYIACLADTIVADPGTITGSIGVISGKFVFEGLYQKLGMKFQRITRGNHAAMMSGDTLYTKAEWESVKAMTQEFYDMFVDHVAKGRNMTTTQVDDIGRGRVFTGDQAKKIGLVDQIGGLRLAIEIARKSAGIPEDRRVNYAIYPESKGFEISGEIGGFISDYLAPDLKSMVADWNKTKMLKDNEPLLLMPFELEVQ